MSKPRSRPSKYAAPAGAPAPRIAPRRCFSYIRFSSAIQGEGQSLERQAEAAARWADRHGMELDASLTFRDLGRSAFHGAHAASGQLADFRDAVRQGLVPQGSLLLVESLDRLSREDPLTAINQLNELCGLGISVVALDSGKEFTSEVLRRDPMALMLAVMVAIRAHEESVTKGGRVRDAWAAKRKEAAENRTPMTKMLPAWMVAGRDGTPKLHAPSARTVRRIFQMYARGLGLTTIQSTLNRERVPTFQPSSNRKASMWYESYLSRLLRNPATMGTYQPMQTRHEGTRRIREPAGQPIRKFYPAAISEALFNQVQAMAADARAPAGHKAHATQNLFGGILECTCGSTMRRRQTYRSGKGTTFVYAECIKARAGVPGKKHRRAVPYGPLEATLIREAPVALSMIPPGDSKLARDLEMAGNNIEALQDQRATLLGHMARSNSPSLAATLGKLEAELKSLEAARGELLARSDASTPALLAGRAAELLRVLQAQPLDRPRANGLIRSLFSAAKVDAVAGMLTLVWKHGAETELHVHEMIFRNAQG